MPKGDHSKPKVYPPEMVAEVIKMYESGMTQVEVGQALGVTQRVIFTLMRNHNIPRRPRVKRDQRGDKNSSWRGDEAAYAALHKRVEVARGKPTKCERCGSSQRKCEWANLTGNYADTNDYERMCRSCHRKMDRQRRMDTGTNTMAHVPRRTKRK